MVHFYRKHRGATFASSALLGPTSDAFVQEIERFVRKHGIAVVEFAKGQRKDDVAQESLRDFPGQEGLLFVGKAPEKANVSRTRKRRHPDTGQPSPWSVRVPGPRLYQRGVRRICLSKQTFCLCTRTAR